MTDIVDRIMALWLAPPPDDEEATEAFRALYTDPVLINGAPLPATDLVTRMRMLHGAFTGLRHEILHRVDASDQVVIAFLMRGTHTGPYRTPLGEVAPTGRQVAIRTIDILSFTAGRVSEVAVVADEMGLLTGLGALRLA
ncbi:MAG: ester cyclase [Pseudonocardiaceae bacterium]